MSRVVLPVFGLALFACSPGAGPSPLSTSSAVIAPSQARPSDVVRAPSPAPVEARALVESPESRDPFRAYPTLPSPPEDTRPRKSKRWSVEQLKLVGLVTNTAAPRAMLMDPSGRGWIVGVGDLVGRAETVRTGAGERAVSFRVDRIRANEIVLVRDDAGSMGEAATTRVIAMREEPLVSVED